MDPTTQPELVPQVKPVITHAIGSYFATKGIAQPTAFTLSVPSSQQPLPVPQVQTSKAASAMTQIEYNKILNRGLILPVRYTPEAYEAVIEARRNELEEQGIFPPDAD